jgi:hypothetical protein
VAKTIANCTFWLDTVAIASQVNQVTIQSSAKEVDVTTFANVGMARLGGLKDGVISAAGFWESNPDPDFTLFGDVGANVPMTVALALNAQAGAPAYLMCAQIAQYGGLGGKVGNPLAFSLRGAQNAGGGGSSGNVGRLAQGVLAENRIITATGSGIIYGPLVPPANALQKMVAALHVTAVAGSAGPSLNLALYSAATAAFTSPTLRASFNAVTTAVASQILEVPGPITDQYWGFAWTVAGTLPSYTIAASLGLAP